MGASATGPHGEPFGPKVNDRYAAAGGLVHQGVSAELIAEKWGISREELDTYAVSSHRRADLARSQGRFDPFIVPVTRRTTTGGTGADALTSDEGIRPDTSLEILGQLTPAFRPDGRVTAGNSSQITDGASAALIMSEQRASELGLRARARFHRFAVAASDPVLMLTAPIPATEKVLRASGLSIDDIDVLEINEAFASVVLAWVKDIGADPARVNPNGGAIAIGHPLGATGVRVLTSLLGELERTGGRFGLQTICEGGGMANAMVIERC